MTDSTLNNIDHKIRYSKLLSSLFCSTSIILLSILCLLNYQSLDIYSAGMLLKIVIPGSFCFWFLGNIMGHILDNNQGKQVVKMADLTSDNEAYEMPSMFASEDTASLDDGLGDV